MSNPQTDEQREDERLEKSLDLANIIDKGERVVSIEKALKSAYLQGKLDQQASSRVSYDKALMSLVSSGYSGHLDD